MWILRCLRRVKPSQQHNTATQIRKVQRPALPPLPSPTPSCFHEADELSTEQGERAPADLSNSSCSCDAGRTFSPFQTLHCVRSFG